MKESFDDLITPHIHELIRLAFTYVKNKQLAEDIVQEVLLKAFLQYEQFRGQSTYKTYLYKMVINKCHDYFRSNLYKKEVMKEKWNQVFSPQKNQLELLIEKENKYLLSLEILQLKPIYREVIVLRFYKQFSVREISHLIDISEKTVNTRLLRAKNKLKVQLEKGGLKGEFEQLERRI